MYGLTQGTPVNVQAKVQARKSGAATPSTDLLLKRSISAPHNPSAVMLLSWLAIVSARIVVIG